jgi:V/A-type H+-transporting ATPase subunit F
MYKFVVVTDSDRAPGFRLAGAEVIEAADAAEARRLIPQLLYKDDIGIVAVNEEYMLSLDEKVMDRIEKMHRPLIIPLPSKSKEVDRRTYIERLLKKAIGYNIVLKR